jgi:APA family basic amino acid/polyamine antiporter
MPPLPTPENSASNADRESAVTKNGLGLLACTSLVVGNMIGSGIFLLPASLAPYGGISVLGWAFTTLGAVCLALVFAKLASLVPKAGGPYAYTRVGFGDFTGFWIAWGYWISTWSGNAAISVAMVSYLRVFVPAMESTALACAVAVAAIWVLTWVNCRGLRAAGWMQVATTVLKLVPLSGIALFGIFWLKKEHFVPFNPTGASGFSAVSAVAALTLWSFLGLESATIPAEAVDRPEKTIPRATVIGTLAVAVVYILGTVAVMGALPREVLAKSGAPFADAARAMWGDWAYYFVGFGAVIACFGALNGWILVQGQIPMAAAQDRLFPGQFGRLSRAGVPAFGLVVSSLLVTALLLFNYSGTHHLVEIFDYVILLATLSTLVPYVFCAMAEVMILVRDRPRFRGERFTGSVIIALAAFAYSGWAIYGSGARTVMFGFLLLVAGIPVYVLLRRQQARESTADYTGAGEGR